MKSSLTTLTRALAACLGFAAAAASAQAPIELRLATAAPPNTPWQKQLDRFAADVAAETKGDVKIKVFYGAQLGSEQDAGAQVARGRIDFAFLSINSLALQIPETILASPYMYWDSNAQRECVLDKHLLEPMRTVMARKGFQLLNWMEVGPNNIVAKFPAPSPADVKGKKLGLATSKIATNFWELQGVVPVPTAITEGASSLSTGLVDFALLPPIYYVAAGFGKIAPVYTLTAVQQTPGALVMSKIVYDKLTPAQRDGIIRAVAKVPASQMRAEIAAVENVMLNKHKEAGGTVVELTAAQRAEWRKPLAPFYVKAAKDLGPEGERLFAISESAKKSCGN